jgi:ribosomal protein S18 acetylase RimI-like enzyme
VSGGNGLYKEFYSRHASLQDTQLAVNLFNRISQHYLGTDEADLESVGTDWESPGFSPGEDILLIFDPGDRLVGYVEVWTNASPPVHPYIWLRVDPAFENFGIGEFLLVWGEKRAREAMVRCPDGARVTMRCAANARMPYLKEIFLGQGMDLIRHSFRMMVEMEDMPPLPTLPAGIEVRNPEHTGQEIETIFRVDKEAFQDHFGYVEEPFEKGLARFSHHFLQNENYSDPGLWFLAEEGDEMVGICLCRKAAYGDPEAGYVSTLAVRRPWRKQGIGFGLLRLAFREYYQRGFRKVYLGVDGENLTGALRLYRKAGMEVYWQYDIYEKELRPGQEISVTDL